MTSALAPLKPELISPADLDIVGEPDESFPTLEQNARSKARFYFERGGSIPTIAEDTGLFVEALRDELGVKTRRWGAGPSASDDEWLVYFLKRLEPEKNRNAKFIAVLAYIDEKGVEHVFESEALGTIVREPQAEYLPGLPVSCVFLPEGYDRVFSALTHEEKAVVSHRGKAIAQFIEFVLLNSQAT